MIQVKYITVANVVSISRLVLFGGFLYFLAGRQFAVAITLFILSWALDAIDGVMARALRQATELGSLLDKSIDRLVLGLGALVLIRLGYAPPATILLFTKDICLLPVLTIHALRREAIQGVGVKGKMMTFLQGLALLWLVFGGPAQTVVIGVVASLGFLVAFLHLRRL